MPNWRPLASIDGLHKRAAVLRVLREFMHDEGIVEVQTPVMGAATVTDPDVESIVVGGSQPAYLQTSPEYFMKRLLAAGMPSCYQLGPVFRADEEGKLHNREFTLLEWYHLDFDHQQLMFEVAAVVDLVLGPGDYHQVSYADLVEDLNAPRADLDWQFANACAKLPGRVFVVDYPADQAALARVNPHDPAVATRFELIVDGVELANGYWELLDRATHEARFSADLANRKARGLSEPEIDSAFLDAIGHGLPACAGVAMGVDRLVMKAVNADSIERVLAFRR
jgi:lysyl-tRNA synthetase class 2